MSAWLSTMPLDGDSSAACARTAGSRRAVPAADRRRRSATPLAAAVAASASSASLCAGLQATTSLPRRACGTPRAAQYA